MNQQPLAVANWKELLLWIFQRRTRFRVVGDSMLPTLHADQVVLVDPRAYMHSHPQAGDIVIATDPRKQERKIIKRVASVSKAGDCYLLGDNEKLLESTDSRVFGAVSADHILGRVTSYIE